MRLVDGRAGAASVDVAVTSGKFLGDALAPLHQAGVRHGGACAALRPLNAVVKKQRLAPAVRAFRPVSGRYIQGMNPRLPPSMAARPGGASTTERIRIGN